MIRQSTRGKIWIKSLEGQLGLTPVNIRIKIVIIIFFKPNSKFDPRQDMSHWLGWSTCVDPIFFKKKSNQPFLTKKIQQTFTYILS